MLTKDMIIPANNPSEVTRKISCQKVWKRQNEITWKRYLETLFSLRVLEKKATKALG